MISLRTRRERARSGASDRSDGAQSTERFRALVGSEEAQEALEYLLVIGGVAVVIIAGLLAFDAVVAQFVGHVCPSVDTANPLAAIGECIT